MNIKNGTRKNLKQKINQNQLIVTKADKGNTLVIIHNENYYKKIEEFIANNNFEKLPQHITNMQQLNIRTNIYDSSNLINKNIKWKYINTNPRAP